MKNVFFLLSLLLICKLGWAQLNPNVGIEGGGQLRLNSKYDVAGYIVHGYVGNTVLLDIDKITFKIGYGIENNTHENTEVNVNNINTIRTKFVYSSVPVLIDYTFLRHPKIHPKVSGGIVFTRTRLAEKNTIYLDGSEKEGFDERYKHNSPFFIQTSLGCAFELIENLDLNLISDIRYNTVSDNPYDNGYCVPWSFTLKLGLSYCFMNVAKK